MAALPSPWRSRNHPSYWAFVVHRASGIALALFLPLHFWVLALAIRADGSFDRLLHWTEQPLVRLAETILVILLTAHLTGGLRLLAIEFLPWHPWQKTWVALAAGTALTVGLLFLLNTL